MYSVKDGFFFCCICPFKQPSYYVSYYTWVYLENALHNVMTHTPLGGKAMQYKSE